MLDTHRDSTELLAEMRRRSDARRTRPAIGLRRRHLLQQLEAALPLAGISRVADISWLSPAGIQVQQAIRPDTYSHVFFGQNSGSQGKGKNADHARISAIMEAMESFAAEPRNAQLVRGTYKFLHQTQGILRPAQYLPGRARNALSNEPLMWTSALSLQDEAELLVPAEAVFFPFFPADYETATAFASHSTGIAAGVTRLEAVLHGTYEVIERHFRSVLERARSTLTVERIRTASVAGVPCVAALREHHPEFEICILAIGVRGAGAGPTMIKCTLQDAEGRGYAGFSCQALPLAALEAAVIEAQQSAVTIWSGSREDTSIRKLANERASVVRGRGARPPHREVLDIGDLVSRAVQRCSTPRDELMAVIEWMRSLGFAHVLVKDLTRVGIDVPVVRVLIPGTLHPGSVPIRPPSFAEVVMCRFSTDLGYDEVPEATTGER